MNLTACESNWVNIRINVLKISYLNICNPSIIVNPAQQLYLALL